MQFNNPRTDDSPYRAVAPAWHTALVLVILLGFSYCAAGTSNLTIHRRTPVYLLVMLVEWATVAFIGWGLKRNGIRMADLIGDSWPRPVVFFRDLGIAITFIVIAGGGVLQGLGSLLKVAPPASLRALMPQSLSDVIVWVLLSLTAGFCEEVIHRGYLQRQFAALTNSTAAGIILQGIVFGLGHAYQGWKLMLLISIYGMLFGVLARWRRSLRPGMLAHGLQDTIGGLLSRYMIG